MKSMTKTAALAAAATTVAVIAGGLLSARLRVRKADRRVPAERRFIEVDGTRLHYQQQGKGPDVLLIHGAMMIGAEMMTALADAFPGYRVTAVDRPGHGYSDRKRMPSIEAQAALLHGAADRLGLRRPVIVGHSIGGAVALAYGASFPEATSGVVAVAPLAYPGWGPAHVGRAIRGAPLLGTALSHSLLGLTDPLAVRLALRLVFSPQKPTAAFRDTVQLGLLSLPSAMTADGADFTRASFDLRALTERYAAYPAPLHVVVGEKDRILKPARQGVRLAAEIGQARLTWAPGAGHMVHHFAPELVTAAVADVRARSASVPVATSSSADRVRAAAA
jgi:pimeloyl-ACP methyl ester carboxylesterase